MGLRRVPIAQARTKSSRLRQRTGVDRNVAPTSSAADTPSTFLNCGGRLDALQEQLGHRDINTTRIYLRLTGEDVTREVAKGELQGQVALVDCLGRD